MTQRWSLKLPPLFLCAQLNYFKVLVCLLHRYRNKYFYIYSLPLQPFTIEQQISLFPFFRQGSVLCGSTQQRSLPEKQDFTIFSVIDIQ